VPTEELTAVRDLLEQRDRIFSRFRPNSELNFVNGSTASLRCTYAVAGAARELVGVLGTSKR
jgi:hypothetical protein